MSNPPAVAELTPRQLAVLRLINSFQLSRCYSPTLAELARKLNVSRTTVFEHITELQRKGLLTNSPNKARSLRLTPQASRLLSKSCKNKANVQAEAGVPLLGTVAAGLPVEAIENKEVLSFEKLFGNTGEVFALKVAGDSMTGQGINAGDYVICRTASSARNGQIVAAITDDGDATLKRFYLEDNCVRLEAANPAYKPIITKNCRIAGVVIGHIRRI